MDTDKAYLLGLIVGGGVFGNAEDVFKIHLPFRKWGSYHENPDRAKSIIDDILKKIGPTFRAIYGLTIQYETTKGGNWDILCEGNISSVKEDLARYGIACEGEMRGNTDISKIAADLVDDNLKRRFIAGLVDTIGSMAASHRRFTNEYPTISLEIKGYNYKTVCDICNLLYGIGCIPDQVTWNHPNIHCGNDPYYKQWNKGFKIRILQDQYANFGSFSLRTKVQALNESRSLQKETHMAQPCEDKPVNVEPHTVHPAESNTLLPEIIRNGHYLNEKHFCAVLGCEHAPYSQICSLFSQLGKYVIPFPILCKNSQSVIDNIIQNDPLLANRTYTVHAVRVSSLLSKYNDDASMLLYSTEKGNGYPISKVLQAVAYVIANDTELGGKRIKGNFESLLKKHVDNTPEVCIEIHKPDLLTPLVIVGNGRAALIGAKNPKVYEKLVSFDPDNKYKLIVRKITEGDLRDEQ